MTETDIHSRLEFIRSAEKLKDTLRSAHTSTGRIESVAEHSWRLALLAITFSDLLPDLNLLRLLKICVLHDLGEAIHGDVPAPSQSPTNPKADQERTDLQQLLSPLPIELQAEFMSLWEEYEDASSIEAQAAKALDKIETLLQHNQGSNPDDFDYVFNLEYGQKHTRQLPITKRIRAIIDEETTVNTKRSKS